MNVAGVAEKVIGKRSVPYSQRDDVHMHEEEGGDGLQKLRTRLSVGMSDSKGFMTGLKS